MTIFHDDECHNFTLELPTEVIITEISISTEIKHTRQLLKMRTNLRTYSVIKLTRPVLIRPGFLYSIKMKQATQGHFHKITTIKAEVKIRSDIYIKFQGDDIYENEPVSFIIELKFNPV